MTLVLLCLDAITIVAIACRERPRPTNGRPCLQLNSYDDGELPLKVLFLEKSR
nr:hypothetical protein [uncultured Pseudomonas sp.]